jgi:hypothetical protein
LDDAPAYKPVSAEKVVYGARDEGVVILDDGTTARRLSKHYVDTITWRNPRTNAVHAVVRAARGDPGDPDQRVLTASAPATTRFFPWSPFNPFCSKLMNITKTT